jgi:CBS domain-containing protein
MLVADVMTNEVVTASPTMTIKEVDELFTVHAISGAPVLDDGALVGVISQSDVIQVLYDEQLAAGRVSQYLLSPYPIPLPALTEIARDRAHIVDRMINTTVAEAMTTVPVTVAPSDSVSVVARLMCDERVHRVLVTKNEELVGIVSALDLARLLITEESIERLAG